eukprot:scaffold19292_cov51-Isochrysis_galbana.AAC.1
MARRVGARVQAWAAASRARAALSPSSSVVPPPLFLSRRTTPWVPQWSPSRHQPGIHWWPSGTTSRCSPSTKAPRGS